MDQISDFYNLYNDNNQGTRGSNNIASPNKVVFLTVKRL